MFLQALHAGRERERSGAPEIHDLQSLKAEDDKQCVAERDADPLRDGLQRLRAIDGRREARLDVVELQLLLQLLPPNNRNQKQQRQPVSY